MIRKKPSNAEGSSESSLRAPKPSKLGLDKHSSAKTIQRVRSVLKTFFHGLKSATKFSCSIISPLKNLNIFILFRQVLAIIKDQPSLKIEKMPLILRLVLH